MTKLQDDAAVSANAAHGRTPVALRLHLLRAALEYFEDHELPPPDDWTLEATGDFLAYAQRAFIDTAALLRGTGAE